MHAHIIGIAGVGMGATAILLKEAGWTITGSDENAYPPMSTFLESKGISIQTPYTPANIPEHVDLFIVGKSAKLDETNPEIAAVRTAGVLVKDFAQVVGETIKDRTIIAAVGSSGKSTCASILTWALQATEPDCGYFIGALAKDLPLPAHRGTSPHFVIEGDEYPTGHHDDRSKFMHYNVHDVLLTSIEYDHANIFKTPESYTERFHELITRMPTDGLVVACGDGADMEPFLRKTGHSYMLYGLHHDLPWHAKNIVCAETTTFTLIGPDVSVPITTQLLGTHNIQNIVGAAALLITKRLLTPEQFATRIASFTGVRRRLDKLTKTSVVPLYEGFGSSREKALAAIHALRDHFPSRPLVVIFEPHTFSWRNRRMLHWYDDTFSELAHLYVYHPGTHGSATHDQATHEEIMQYLHARGVSASPITSPEDIYASLRERIRGNEVLLALTSGHMDGALETLPAWLDEHYTRTN